MKNLTSVEGHNGTPIIPSSPFKSKSHETKVKKTLPPANEIQANIQIWPCAGSGFGVAVRLNEKGLKAQLCRTKQEIIQFLEREL